MIFTICTLSFFSLVYAIKGGQGKEFFKNWEYARNKNKITNFILSGKVISTIFVFFFVFIAFQDFNQSALFAIAWLAAVSPSMGEEHGAIGRFGKAWGDYIDNQESFGRMYGIKKALQRGVWMGACMALATGYVPYICFSSFFIPCVFLGQELYFRLYKTDSWFISEFLIGALCFGAPTILWVL